MSVLGTLLFAFVACGGAADGEVCDNGSDDDADGFADCEDQDCDTSCREQCGNGADDDGDGLVDCSDPQCSAGCFEDCFNGKDDDDDGHADCEDSSCSALCTELCDNGVDDDGDLIVDCWDSSCTGTCDQDGDGYFATAFGYDDCDDADDLVNPVSPEIYYDGIDNDCNAATDDGDQDGDNSPVAEDCDDLDSKTFPGAPESCGDQVNNDCDGAPASREACFGDRDWASADALLLGQSSGDSTGASAAFAGDVNDDGNMDFLVGAPRRGLQDEGAAYLVLGPVVGTMDLGLAAGRFAGAEGSDELGSGLAGGADFTGDGRPDIALGAHYYDAAGGNTGMVYIFHGSLNGDVAVAQAEASLAPANDFTEAGWSLAVSADLNGDGQPDIAIGAPKDDTGGPQDRGGVYVAFGPLSGSIDLSDPAIPLLSGATSDDNAGHSVSAGSDINADGLDDLVVGAPNNDLGGQEAGGAYVVYGPIVTSKPLQDADAVYAGNAADTAGAAVASLGDSNADGFGDWAVGAPLSDACGEDGGLVAIHYGPSAGLLTEADVALCGSGDSDGAGASVHVAGLVDEGSQTDLAVGADFANLGGTDGGVVYVIAGPFGNASLDEAAFTRIQGAAFSFAGSAVIGGQDANGDGYGDILIGAMAADGTSAGSGAAALFTFDL